MSDVLVRQCKVRSAVSQVKVAWEGNRSRFCLHHKLKGGAVLSNRDEIEGNGYLDMEHDE